MIKSAVFLVVLSFILRSLFINQGAVSFHYDMSRDAFTVQQLLKGDIKLQGPPTSTANFYHGPLYYYLIAPAYKIGNGDPRVVAFFLSFWNSITIIPIILLCLGVYKNLKLALLGGLLFAISFEATQYGPWLSNPAPSIFTTAMFFFSLWIWKNGNLWGLPLAIFWATLSTQFQFFLIYLLFLIPIFEILFKASVNLKYLVISYIVGLLGLGSFIISAIKFGSLNSMVKTLIGPSEINQLRFHTSFSDIFLGFVNKFTDVFIYNFFPSNVFVGGLIALMTIYFTFKNKFVLFCLLSSLILFPFFDPKNATFVNLYGMVTPAILAILELTKRIWLWNKRIAVLFVILIVISNVYTTLKISPFGQQALVIPKDMFLSQQLQLINKTYQLANGEQFSINSLTLPLWTNTTWAYLYSWYGQKEYGYVPYFYGHDQVGLLGAGSLPKTEKPFDKTFFIIEPHVGIPEDRYQWEIGSEDSKTELIKQYEFGELKLQYRKPKTDG